MRYLRPCFCYKMIEHNLVRLHKPIIIWECTKVEDARRPDPPTSWALTLSSYLIQMSHNSFIMASKTCLFREFREKIEQNSKQIKKSENRKIVPT